MTTIAYRLRQRITIEQPGLTQDPVTGEMISGWTLFADKVPASVEPLSARDFIAAQANQSEISARIVIRYRPGVLSTMRIIHRGKVYGIQGVLADKESGLEYLTLPVTEGVGDGG